MPSTAALVENYLEGDLIIERALDRGILNLRRGARWLIEHNGWDATEEAVVSALRRYSPRRVHAAIDEGYDLLRGARTGLGTGLGLVTVPRTGGVRDRVEAILERQGEGGPIGVLPGSDTVSFLTTRGEAQDIEALHGEEAKKVVYPVSKISISVPQGDPAGGMALSILLQTFSYRDIPLLEVSSSGGTYAFYVPGGRTSPAHKVLRHLRADLSADS